ncbi:unnamed protein product [Musa acuminata subsp. malaccensis]|uniref:(wild Malaysian banana) hypothetical protein n=1 Tax=Musa acuminata subsp. malaccensis TaxID=214687 RepID=A0A804I4K7_MUSAM|nr:PREDICTED: uncharacterized protein LOC103975254 isoform X2 [Musa acuminata subsp. malaccensis]CAG1862541.1 unnamed protein product [Musa acuminata subsp. malaccensis]
MATRPFPPLLRLRSSLLPSTPLLALLSLSSLRCRTTKRRLASLHFLPSPPRTVRSLATVTAPPVVVAEDDKYGRKQVISVTPQLYGYILSNVREPPILRELREETATMPGSQMQDFLDLAEHKVSPDQAQLLAMLVQILGAQRCIEVGIYTGYSSLAIALVLPESGRLVACERDVKCLEIAKKYYERAGVSHKVDIKHGLAVESLRSLIQNGESCSFDFAFVDAEKRMYSEYFELLLQLVRIGGLIVIDNVLWHGKVADPQVNDSKTISLRNFNRKILEDKRISTSMVPIGDGMTICQKRADI